MLTCCPQLIRNFIYDGVTLADVLRRPAALLKAMVARDLLIAETFCRHFWWHTLTCGHSAHTPSSVYKHIVTPLSFSKGKA